MTRPERLSVPGSQVSALRLHRHHLDARAPRGSLPLVVGEVRGVQTQVTSMARIALWARLRGLTMDDVEQALLRKRTIVKTWSLRGALHLHRSSDLPVVLRALMPTRLPLERRWITRARLDEEKTTAMVLRALHGGPLTRAQLSDYLRKRLGAKTDDWRDGGWGRKTVGSATTWHLVEPAVARGLVCYGPSDGQEVTFVRLNQWLRKPPAMPTEREAEESLLRSYLHTFGPANVKDFRAWSGIRARQAVPILGRLEDELVEVESDGHRGFLLRKDLPDLEATKPEPGVVRLLPSFDPFMLGHYHRGHLVDRARYREVYKDQGWLAPVVLLDGRVVATWTYRRQPTRLDVDVTTFKKLDREVRSKIEDEAGDLARFLGSADMALRFP